MNLALIESAWDDVQAVIAYAMQKNKSEIGGIGALRNLWQQNKKWLLHYFGEDGRISTEIPISDTRSSLNSYMGTSMSKIAQSLTTSKRRISNRFAALAESWEPLCDILSCLYVLVTPEEFVQNRILSDKQIPYTSKVIKAQTKFTKMIPIYINEMYDSDCDSGSIKCCGISVPKDLAVDFITTLYSQVITNFKKANPRLVLSINPLDMLLASANTTGWRTCHDIFKGAFACGCITYMCDPCTIIGYTTFSDSELVDHSGNIVKNHDMAIISPRKQWRRMIYIDEKRKAIALGRQFPNVCEAYDKASRIASGQLLQRMFNDNSKWMTYLAYDDSTIDENMEAPGRVPVCGGLSRASSFFYLDAPETEIWLPNSGPGVSLEVGIEKLPCVICGTPRDDIAAHELDCIECAKHFKCEECNRIYRKSNLNKPLFISRYNITVCQDCYNSEYVNCTDCEDIVKRADCVWVSYDKYMCDRCLSKSYTAASV